MVIEPKYGLKLFGKWFCKYDTAILGFHVESWGRNFFQIFPQGQAPPVIYKLV